MTGDGKRTVVTKPGSASGSTINLLSKHRTEAAKKKAEAKNIKAEDCQESGAEQEDQGVLDVGLDAV